LFEQMGGRFMAGAVVESVKWDGVSAVVTKLHGGEEIRSDKLVSALGRVANVERLDLAATGLAASPQGFIEVDREFRTKVTGISAVGDVIGPPSLASTGMDQGRRAVCHALGLDSGTPAELVPLGVYTVPEMSSVGLTEAQAILRFGSAMVGRAQFHELARGQISSAQDGLLKLIADPAGKLVGVQIIGEGASELIHVGQMALLGQLEIRAFIDNAFNFPTLAEGYRVAALDALARSKL
jgi:NAD(P) transhydrogenase